MRLTIWTRKRLIRCAGVDQQQQQQRRRRRQQSGQPMRIGCRRFGHVADLKPIKVERAACKTKEREREG